MPGMNCRRKFTGAARQLHLRIQRRRFIEFSLGNDLRNIEGKVRRNLDRLDFGLLQFAVESELIVLQFRDQIEGRRFEFRVIRAAKIAHLHIEPPAQLRERALSIELHIDQPGRAWRRPEVFEKPFQIEVLGLKIRQHFSIRRNHGLRRSDVFPDKRQRHITGSVLGLALIDLDFRDLQRRTFRGKDRLKIHFVALQEDDRDIETFGRIVRIDICLERPQIGVAPFLELQFQFSGILEIDSLATAFPVDQERAGHFIGIANDSQQRLQTGEVRNIGVQFAVVSERSFERDESMPTNGVVLVQS